MLVFLIFLATSAAGASILLGFLPTRELPATFFERPVLVLAICWSVIALQAPAAAQYSDAGIAGIAFFAWWRFRLERPLSGKMWLSLASGFGVGIGVVYLLEFAPAVYPPGCVNLAQAFNLSAIYTGGACVGGALVCIALLQARAQRLGATAALLGRYLDFLWGLVLLRCSLLFANLLWPRDLPLPISLVLAGLAAALLVTAFLGRRAFAQKRESKALRLVFGVALLASLLHLLALPRPV